MSSYRAMYDVKIKNKALKEQEKKLISEFLNDLEHQYDYGSDEDMEKLIQKWEKRLDK